MIIKNTLQFYWEKIHWTHYLNFVFEKYIPSQVLKDFSVENLETTSSTFLSKFSSGIYLSQISNYWGSIFTSYLTLGMFSLVCALSGFFSFFLFFFFFLLLFALFTYIHGRSSSRFVPLLFNRSIWITRLVADEACSSSRFAFYLLIHWCNKSESLTLIFQSDIVRIWAHIELSPFYYTPSHHCLPITPTQPYP